MSKLISQFIKFIVASRLAWLLFLIHLLLVLYAVGQKPRVNSESWDWGGGCHGVPIADRVLFYCDETGLLKVIATLDLAGIVLYAIYATFFGWIPTGSFHFFSWIVAAILLIYTSFQWMLIGSCTERLLLHVRKKHSGVRSNANRTCP